MSWIFFLIKFLCLWGAFIILFYIMWFLIPDSVREKNG